MAGHAHTPPNPPVAPPVPREAPPVPGGLLAPPDPPFALPPDASLLVESNAWPPHPTIAETTARAVQFLTDDFLRRGGTMQRLQSSSHADSRRVATECSQLPIEPVSKTIGPTCAIGVACGARVPRLRRRHGVPREQNRRRGSARRARRHRRLQLKSVVPAARRSPPQTNRHRLLSLGRPGIRAEDGSVVVRLVTWMTHAQPHRLNDARKSGEDRRHVERPFTVRSSSIRR